MAGTERFPAKVVTLPVDQTLDLQPRMPKVQQQAQPEPGRLQIIHALRPMDRVQHVDGFQFDQHRILDQQIGRVRSDDHPS
jgi:hypothetical protein